MLPQLLRACFLQHGNAQGSLLQPKRVAHEQSEGVWPFEVAAGSREPSLTAKSRPNTIDWAYPDKWTPLPCAYCRLSAIWSFTVDNLSFIHTHTLSLKRTHSLSTFSMIARLAAFSCLCQTDYKDLKTISTSQCSIVVSIIVWWVEGWWFESWCHPFLGLILKYLEERHLIVISKKRTIIWIR